MSTEGARDQSGPPPLFGTPETRLGFGAWAVGGQGWGSPGDETDRIAAVRHAVERGITVFDTAPTYGDGASETLLGRALRGGGGDRDRVTLATKVGPRDDPRKSLEQSLRRLGTDRVDLVQLHEALERWEWVLEGLHRLQEDGKARAIGICNATHLQLARARAIAPIVSYQGPYNLFDRDVEQRELPFCRAHALAFLAYRPLASGLLTGKYAVPPEFPSGDHRARLYWFKGAEFERRKQVITNLRPVAAQAGMTLPGLALAWVLSRPGVSVVLAGAKDRQQVEENLTATGHLTPGTLAAIETIVVAAFRPVSATPALHQAAATWGERERFIAQRLDGKRLPEEIAAEWTDRGLQPMVAAQVKVFVDQLRERHLVDDA